MGATNNELVPEYATFVTLVAASAIFLATPPRVKFTVPGMVEWGASEGFTLFFPCAMTSIAAQPTMTTLAGFC